MILGKYRKRIEALEEFESDLVKHLGDQIGYGRLMQLAEQIWNKKIPGGAHSVGPCTYNLVHCPHPEIDDEHIHCEWCCGCGRITKRVLDIIKEKWPHV